MVPSASMTMTMIPSSPSRTAGMAKDDQKFVSFKNSKKISNPRSFKNQPNNSNVPAKIIFWNCSNGLISKLDCVKDLIKKYSPYIVFVSEAELRNEDQIKACSIQNYTLHVSKGFNTWRARSCCYVRDGHDLKRVDLLESSELIVIDSPSLKLRMGGFYRPFTPPPGLTIKELDDEFFLALKEACVTPMDVIFGGDMNIDLLRTDKRSLELQEWISSSGLEQNTLKK